MLKKALCLVFAFLLSINSFAAIVSDNDGSAFVTKKEFDALKKDFADQIGNYNTSIDEKIDGAIASYLAGVNLARKQVIDSLLNKCVETTVNGRDIKFANAYTRPSTQTPTSARNSFLCLMLGGYAGSLGGTRYQCLLGRWGSPRSVDAGRHWLNDDWHNNNLICMACKKYDNYWAIVDKYIYGVKYSVYIVGGSHGWAWGENNVIPTGGTTGVMNLSDLRWAGAVDQKCDWAEMRKDATIYNTVTSWYSGSGGQKDFAATFQQYYEKSYDTNLNTNYVSNLGYCVDNISDSDKMYVIDDTTWHEAIDKGTTSQQNVKLTITLFPTDSYSTNQYAKGEYTLAQKAFQWYNYFHDYKEIYLDKLANVTATTVIGDNTNYVKLYEGLPIFETPNEGTVKFTIKGTAYITDSSDNTKDALYTGDWAGKIYLNKARFGKNTTESNYDSKDDVKKTEGIDISKTNDEQTIECNVQKGETYWIKFVPSTTTSGLKIQLETKDDIIFTGQ